MIRVATSTRKLSGMCDETGSAQRGDALLGDGVLAGVDALRGGLERRLCLHQRLAEGRGGGV